MWEIKQGNAIEALKAMPEQGVVGGQAIALTSGGTRERRRMMNDLHLWPGYDPLLDTMDKKRRLGLHTLRLLR